MQSWTKHLSLVYILSIFRPCLLLWAKKYFTLRNINFQKLVPYQWLESHLMAFKSLSFTILSKNPASLQKTWVVFYIHNALGDVTKMSRLFILDELPVGDLKYMENVSRILWGCIWNLFLYIPKIPNISLNNLSKTTRKVLRSARFARFSLMILKINW